MVSAATCLLLCPTRPQCLSTELVPVMRLALFICTFRFSVFCRPVSIWLCHKLPVFTCSLPQASLEVASQTCFWSH
jgi:hypothetical protein